MDMKMDLRPPVRRSWLRLRLGKAYYAGKRYLLWCSPKYIWAKQRQQERLPAVQASHATPCCGISGERKWSGRRTR